MLYFNSSGEKRRAIIQSLDYQLTEELMNTKSANSNKIPIKNYIENYKMYKMKINQIWAMAKMCKWNHRKRE